MKASFLKFTAFLLLASFGFSLTAEASFLDTDENPYQESIEFLQESGILEGYEDGEFKPSNGINRAELLKVIFLALDEDAGEGEGNCFLDVQEEWFAPYVCRAKELGIVQGYPDGFYHPEREVNMVEAFKIVIEAFGLMHDEVEGDEAWYQPYVDFVHNNGFFSRYSYFPDRSSQRDEMAFLVHQMLRLFSGVEEISLERDASSEGCSLDAPSEVPTSFRVDGVERSAIVVIPENYNKDEPLPLLFAFHGRTNSNTQVRSYYRIERAGEGEAIFVYPAGLSNGSSFTWSDSGDSADELRDFEFFDVMYEELTSTYCVNLDEVYAVGHSLGGWFTNSLACARGDVLRGVATLGGARTTGTCSGPVAVMQWHNPNDNLASFSSGELARNDYIEQNQCSYDNVSVEPTWANCVEYQNCLVDAPMLWCPHPIDYDEYSGEYYPHTWPKEAGAEMWDFLRSL